EKKTNILIGTQMVSKGFDFEGVSLTGIINADNILNFPDFRSFERSYQLMVQVSGRAGRKSKPGKVIIQTSDPEHHIIKDIVSNNYIRMFNKELNDRKEFNYPPYSRLVKIYLKHKDKNTVHKASIELVSMLSSYFGNMVLGPETPIINRIKNRYLRNILIKIDNKKSKKAAKKIIKQNIVSLLSKNNYKSLIINPDVDPF
ncbi:primosomal protein N', partial [Bacteroidota bacterium]